MKIWKKLMAMLLCAAICLSLSPTWVLADSAAEPDPAAEDFAETDILPDEEELLAEAEDPSDGLPGTDGSDSEPADGTDTDPAAEPDTQDGTSGDGGDDAPGSSGSQENPGAPGAEDGSEAAPSDETGSSGTETTGEPGDGSADADSEEENTGDSGDPETRDDETGDPAEEPEDSEDEEPQDDPAENADGEITETIEGEEFFFSSGSQDNESLLNAYVEEQLDSLRPGAVTSQDWKVLRGDTLTGLDKKLYDGLSLRIKQVAAGEEVSTYFQVTYSELGTVWTAEELGVDQIVEVNESGKTVICKDAKDAALAKLPDRNVDDIVGALLDDLPFDLYWHNKTASTKTTLSYKARTDGTTLGIQLGFKFPVAEEYAASAEYTVDPSKGTAVQTALENITTIIDTYRESSDYDKLHAYKDVICEWTAYDSAAARNSDTPYGNPWQLIWVFDGDPSTKVVCEGYAKAFTYLCDLSEFSMPISTWAVMGTMSSGSSSGYHMWNIVSMQNGKNYLVDVTNSDKGTAGASNDQLFMQGATRGSVSAGYTFAVGAKYVYDVDTLALFTDDLLTLSATSYLTDYYDASKPAGLEWGKAADGDARIGMIRFRTGNLAGARYRVEIYRKGETAPLATDLIEADAAPSGGIWAESGYIADHLEEIADGEYYFTVTAISGAGDYPVSETVESGIWTFVRATESLPAPTDLAFDEARPWWSFDGDSSLVGGARAVLYYAATEDGTLTPTEITVTGAYAEAEKQLRDRMKTLMEQMGEGWYAWELQLLTADITVVLDSETSARSALCFISQAEIADLGALPESFRLELSRSYLILEKGSDAVLTANLSGLAQSRVRWTTESADVGADRGFISVTEGEVTALQIGTDYVLAEYTRDGITYTARCRVDVVESFAELSDVTASLSENRVTVELYRTDYTRLGIILAIGQNQHVSAAGDTETPEGGDELQSAPSSVLKAVRLEAADKNDITRVLRAEILDDRYVRLIPTVDLSSAAAVKAVKTSYKARVVVTLEDGTTQGTELDPMPLTVAVKKTAPSVKAAAVKLNSFIPGDSAPITLTGGTVTEIVNYTAPSCVSLDPGTLTLTQQGTGRGTVNLECRLDGWAGTWKIPVSVNCAMTKPTLRLSASSVSLKPGTSDVATVQVSVKLAGVEDLDYILSVVPEGVAGNYIQFGTDRAAGLVTARLKSGVSTDSVEGKSLKASVVLSLGANRVAVPLTVRILADSAKVSVSGRVSGAIDTALPGSPITLTAQVRNYNASGDELSLSFLRLAEGEVEELTEEQAATLFRVKREGTVFTVSAADSALLKEELDWKCSFSAVIRADVGLSEIPESSAVRLSVKTSTKVPAAKLSYKTSGSIDVLRPDTSLTVTPTVKNWYERDLEQSDLHLYRKDGATYTDVTGEGLFSVSFDGTDYTLTAGSGLNPKAKYFAAIPAATVGAAKETYRALAVKMGPAKVSLSRTALALSKKDCYDRESVVLSLADPTLREIGQAEVVLVDKSANFALTALGSGEYAVGYAGSALPKNIGSLKTATVKLKVYLAGNGTHVFDGTDNGTANATLSVKITLN